MLKKYFFPGAILQRKTIFQDTHCFAAFPKICTFPFFSQESVKNICKLDVRGDFYYSYFLRTQIRSDRIEGKCIDNGGRIGHG
jgi:hypothetical protein